MCSTFDDNDQAGVFIGLFLFIHGPSNYSIPVYPEPK